MPCIRMDRDRGLAGIRGSGLRLAVLQVAREIGQETGEHLHADPVTGEECIAGDEIVQVDLIDPAWLKPLAPARKVAVARALHVEARTHQVENPAIRRGVERVVIGTRIVLAVGRAIHEDWGMVRPAQRAARRHRASVRRHPPRPVRQGTAHARAGWRGRRARREQRRTGRVGSGCAACRPSELLRKLEADKSADSGPERR